YWRSGNDRPQVARVLDVLTVERHDHVAAFDAGRPCWASIVDTGNEGTSRWLDIETFGNFVGHLLGSDAEPTNSVRLPCVSGRQLLSLGFITLALRLCFHHRCVLRLALFICLSGGHRFSGGYSFLGLALCRNVGDRIHGWDTNTKWGRLRLLGLALCLGCGSGLALLLSLCDGQLVFFSLRSRIRLQ